VTRNGLAQADSKCPLWTPPDEGARLPEFVSSPLKIWRVEPDKFAIQLSVADKKDEKQNIADAGTKQAISIAFGGKSACNVP
jgi:hypothetical protein